MKAPQLCPIAKSDTETSLNYTKDKSISKSKEEGTSKLLKWIAEVTFKRRQIRRKFHCSNLRAEALLSRTLLIAKDDLASRQEAKRRRLQNFFNSPQISQQKCEFFTQDKPLRENNGVKTSRSELDEEVQSCLASLDSFFEELDDSLKK